MDIMELIKGQLNGDALKKLSEQIGGTPEQTKQGVESAIPSMLNQLTKKAKNPKEAAGIMQMLDRDGDGDFMDDIQGFIGQGNNSHGASDIVNSLFGKKREKMEKAVSKESGLSKEASSNLLQQLGPMITNLVGKQKKEGGMDFSNIMNMLNQQTGKAGGKGKGKGIMGFLDQDGDGDVVDDVKGMLGGLFGRKKRR